MDHVGSLSIALSQSLSAVCDGASKQTNAAIFALTPNTEKARHSYPDGERGMRKAATSVAKYSLHRCVIIDLLHFHSAPRSPTSTSSTSTSKSNKSNKSESKGASSIWLFERAIPLTQPSLWVVLVDVAVAPTSASRWRRRTRAPWHPGHGVGARHTHSGLHE